jgi:hypothetical protein
MEVISDPARPGLWRESGHSVAEHFLGHHDAAAGQVLGRDIDRVALADMIVEVRDPDDARA